MIANRLLLAAGLAAALSGAVRAGEPAGADAMVRGAIAGYVLPAYATFARETSELRQAAEALCAAPSSEALAQARGAFSEAVDAWSGIELVRFGPVTENNRLERILHWPDRRSTGLKQVQALLADEDGSATDARTLAGKSVAVQGLGALEFVLFGAGSEALGETAGYRCAYAAAIAAHLATVAATVTAEWQAGAGAAGLWAQPGPDNPLYRDGAEALSELMDVLVHGVELVRDVRLGGFLGAEAGDDRPKQALFWRSGETLAAIRGNLASIAGLLGAADVAAHLPEDRRWIVQSAIFELANADRALAALGDRPIADILADPEARAKLAYVRIVTAGLSDVIGRQITGGFGLAAGFSSLDGD
jgi:predicted lipoprotein